MKQISFVKNGKLHLSKTAWKNNDKRGLQTAFNILKRNPKISQIRIIGDNANPDKRYINHVN